jgi:hypothetical protein
VKRKLVVPLDIGEKRLAVTRARDRVLKLAKKQGYITHADAKQAGGWRQAYYHLRAMEEAKLLRYGGFNRWIPR